MAYYIIGINSYAREVYDYFFLKENKYEFGGFITLKGDKAFVLNNKGVEPFKYTRQTQFILATEQYTDTLAKSFISKYEKDKFPTMVSELSYISNLVSLGFGNIIAPHSSILGSTILGNFNRLSINSLVHSGASIGSFNKLSPFANIAKNCTVGNGNSFKENSHISANLKIANNNLISPGECLFENLTSDKLFQSGVVMKRKDT